VDGSKRQDLPGGGYAYCGPTSMVMGLYYLHANGFTQPAPGPFVGQDDSVPVNLERIIAGLCRTSSSRGTFENGLQHGIANYLSACGISPSRYAKQRLQHGLRRRQEVPTLEAEVLGVNRTSRGRAEGS
jgi:hypothetical protein